MKFDAEQRAAKTAAREDREAALVGELAQLRARVETLEQQLPDDARTSGISAYTKRQSMRWRVTIPPKDSAEPPPPPCSATGTRSSFTPATPIGRLR